MEWQAWLTIAVVILVFIALAKEVAGPDILMMGGLLVLALTGVLDEQETFASFSNPAVLTIGALFILSAALRETGAMDIAMSRLIGRARTERAGLARLLPPLAVFSAFINNTTIVAMMTPLLIDWAKRFQLSPSRLLLPLSYATMVGSTMTIMGTSVNLTVAGLMLSNGMKPMGFFELFPVGIFICLAGLVYLLLVTPFLIPVRKDPVTEGADERREYTTAMRVEVHCGLVGETVDDAGLRHLPGLFLIEVDRDDEVITPVGPDFVIQADDRLVFAGVISTIVDLQRIRGLVPVTADDAARDYDPDRRLAEAVISRTSPLVNRSIRETDFRSAYDAAIVAVHRNGERVHEKIGDIVLRPGDTLLLQTGPDFIQVHRNSQHFYLVSELPGTESRRYHRAGMAVAILLGLILATTTETLPIAIAAFVAAGALIATRCISAASARKAIHWPILAVIAAGLGIASAMEKTGAADSIAQLIVGSAGQFGPLVTLGILYFSTTLLSELLNHNASVAIMFPIALATAHSLGVDPRGFVMAIAIGGSCAFANPVSYQTHLIVYGPGGYHFRDFVRTGIPLDLLCGAIALTLIPRFWPF